MMNEKTLILKKIVENIGTVLVGKQQAAEYMVISFAAGGHVLIEDVPGIGKTTMACTLANSVGLSFSRIQFTPDILPSDITGFSIFNQGTGMFEYKEGSVMCNVVLADEINRTSPKTQASMLEVMEEKQVTVDGKTYKVPEPFMVIATQNPIEYLGTYPLPEAQMDRFLMRISIGYPSKSEEINIIERFRLDSPIKDLKPVATAKDIEEVRKKVKEVHIDKSIQNYIVDITSSTRLHPQIALGCSPRASLYLAKAAQAYALYNERAYVLPDDIKSLAIPVLAHRIVLKQEARFKKVKPESVISEIIGKLRTPVL